MVQVLKIMSIRFPSKQFLLLSIFFPFWQTQFSAFKQLHSRFMVGALESSTCVTQTKPDIHFRTHANDLRR